MPSKKPSKIPPCIQVYCTEEEKATIDRAAHGDGRSTSNFCLRELLKLSKRKNSRAGA